MEVQALVHKTNWERSHKFLKFFGLQDRLLAWSHITNAVNKKIVCFASLSRLFV